MYFCGGVSALVGCDLIVTLKKLVLGGCSSSSMTELFDDIDSLPKWCSSHLDVSTFLVSSSWSKSKGFFVSASFLSNGEIPFSKPGTLTSHGATTRIALSHLCICEVVCYWVFSSPSHSTSRNRARHRRLRAVRLPSFRCGSAFRARF